MLTALFPEMSDVGFPVTQGSVLGPLLFLEYVNGLFAIENNNFNIRMFPDDCFLYSAVASQEDPHLLNKASSKSGV